jgi:hypothetical protein
MLTDKEQDTFSIGYVVVIGALLLFSINLLLQTCEAEPLVGPPQQEQDGQR